MSDLAYRLEVGFSPLFPYNSRFWGKGKGGELRRFLEVKGEEGEGLKGMAKRQSLNN